MCGGPTSLVALRERDACVCRFSAGHCTAAPAKWKRVNAVFLALVAPETLYEHTPPPPNIQRYSSNIVMPPHPRLQLNNKSVKSHWEKKSERSLGISLYE